jgi:hypothetical protein
MSKRVSAREFLHGLPNFKKTFDPAKFSTLGGTGILEETDQGRNARHHAKELMLFLEPR